ncbi:MAG: aldehyde dehydrogenase family protein, partial [Actinomycetota bacterium]
MKQVTHFINGAFTAVSSGPKGEIFDPVTGQVSGTVDFASKEVVDQAVEAAAKAFIEWRKTSLAKRSQVLFAFRELLNAKKEELAAIITAEHGKVLSDAL